MNIKNNLGSNPLNSKIVIGAVWNKNFFPDFMSPHVHHSMTHLASHCGENESLCNYYFLWFQSTETFLVQLHILLQLQKKLWARKVSAVNIGTTTRTREKVQFSPVRVLFQSTDIRPHVLYDSTEGNSFRYVVSLSKSALSWKEK